MQVELTSKELYLLIEWFGRAESYDLSRGLSDMGDDDLALKCKIQSLLYTEHSGSVQNPPTE